MPDKSSDQIPLLMKNPYLSLLKTAWQYARQERKLFVLIYSMFVVTNIVIACNPLLYGWFIDSLQRDGGNVLSNAWIYVAGFLGLRLLEWSFHGPARVMERKLAFRLSKNFLEDLYHQVLHLPVGWHHDHHSGATINRIRKGYESLREFFQHGFVFLNAFGKFFFSLTAMLLFSPLFGSIAVLLGIFTVWVIFKFDKPFIKSLKEVNEAENKVSSSLFDSLSNIITVITLRLEKRMEVSLSSKIQHVYPSFKRNVVVNEWKWFAALMLVGIIYTVIVIGYIYQHWQAGQPFMIGGLVTLLVYVNQFTSVFNDIAYQYTRIVQYNTDVEMAKTVTNAYNKEHRYVSSTSLPPTWNKIEIEHLHFFRTEMDGRKKDTGSLVDIHLQISKGKKIALIGESGSGKSTLLALLRGLYSCEKDHSLVIDGADYKYHLSSIAETITLFPQEPEIFENTILYNITLGLPFQKEDILKVCEAAMFLDVIKDLPHGLETHIQEKGVNLSGGQKQRLALARGILSARSSEIILLDEPTSSVDPKTEMHIYEKMFSCFSEKAIISSLHRLHLLNRFDYVYIMDQGKIVDHGTFEHLKANSRIFQNLWAHQKSHESEDLLTL